MSNLSETFKNKFVKVCVNSTRAYDLKTVDDVQTKVPMLFRRGDLTQWAKEAFDRGEDYFYHEPVNPLEPYGRHKLCEPRYKYQLKAALTPEEFETFLQAMESAEQKGE